MIIMHSSSEPAKSPSKRIFIDYGWYYTKVFVLTTTDNGDWEFYGQTFFPASVSEAVPASDKIIYYEHDNKYFTVGYDATLNTLKDMSKISDFTDDLKRAILIIKKIVFDYSENGICVDLKIVNDSPYKEKLFTAVIAELNHKTVEIKTQRGRLKKPVSRVIDVQLGLVSSGKGIFGFLKKIKKKFQSALVVDIGYKNTKAYVVNSTTGVDAFEYIDTGVCKYSEELLKQLSESGIEDVNGFWLNKQIELGCELIEIEGRKGLLDISSVLTNVRWDLNKEILKLSSEIITKYYNNTTKWVDMLVVIGGGALLNGEVLGTALVENDFTFNDVYREKAPMYCILEGLLLGL